MKERPVIHKTELEAQSQDELPRRSFMKQTAALTGAAVLVPSVFWAGCGDDSQPQSLVANPVDLSCDINQGFNFRKDKMVQIGFMTSLKIGDTEMTADLTCKDPENNANDKKVVGVMSYCGWTASPTDPLDLNVQVSETAKNKLDTLTKNNMSNVEVVFQFDCYHYDPSEKKYYKNFHANNTEMHGLIYGQGGDLAIHLVRDPNMVVQEPRNYTLSLGIKPQPTQQELHYASSVSDKLVMQWGVTKA